MHNLKLVGISCPVTQYIISYGEKCLVLIILGTHWHLLEPINNGYQGTTVVVSSD